MPLEVLQRLADLQNFPLDSALAFRFENGSCMISINGFSLCT